ncbi:hypothetical protein FRC17_003051, partial [Serendipita sp. 399]
ELKLHGGPRKKADPFPFTDFAMDESEDLPRTKTTNRRTRNAMSASPTRVSPKSQRMKNGVIFRVQAQPSKPMVNPNSTFRHEWSLETVM